MCLYMMFMYYFYDKWKVLLEPNKALIMYFADSNIYGQDL